jgi:glycosyltransferase involved in cell wall biosynthesis
LKILFFHKNLKAGGAERVIIELFKGHNPDSMNWKLLLGRELGDLFPLARHEWLISVKNDKTALFQKIEHRFRFLTIWNRILWRKKIRIHLTRLIGSELYSSIQSSIENNVKLESLSRLIKVLKRERPKILVSSLVESGHLVAFLALKIAKISDYSPKWVAIEHNNTAVRISDYFPKPEEAYGWELLTKRLYESANHVVAVSHGVSQGLQLQFGIPAEKISVIHNPVPINDIKEAKSFHSNHKYILSAGRLHSQKQFDHLITAYSKVAGVIGRELWIAGDGKLKVQLKDLAHKLGVSEKVRFLGVREDLWSLMKSADLFVMSSKYEGFGMTLTEAMAAKCPVVSYDVDYGPREFIQNGKNGILVSPGSIDDLGQAIKQILASSEYANQMTRQAWAGIQSFEPCEVANQYQKLFSKLSI